MANFNVILVFFFKLAAVITRQERTIYASTKSDTGHIMMKLHYARLSTE